MHSKISIILGASFAVFLAACAPAVVTPTPTVHFEPTALPAASPSPTTGPMPAETVLPEPATPTPITPEIKVIDPPAREVNLSELGLSDTTRLLLYYESSDSLRIMSGHDLKPQKVPNINPKAIISYRIKISPDQKWFVYKVFKEKRDGTAYYDNWISSVDSRQQKIAVPDVRGGIEVRWITSEQVELWDYMMRPCPLRVSVVNPFTQKTLIPPALPASTLPHCFFDLSTNPDHTKIIYRRQNDASWNIYDFTSDNNQPIFPWLSQADSFTLRPDYIRWLPSGINFALPNRDSIDFAIDLSPSSAAKLDASQNKILLPASYKILENSFVWLSLENSMVGFDMLGSDTPPSSDSGETPPSKFVIFDLRNSILYDYNFDRARTGDIQRVSDFVVKASTDQRFLAWTIYTPPGMGSAIETVVLERATGRLARIKGFEFFGWGEVSQP